MRHSIQEPGFTRDLKRLKKRGKDLNKLLEIVFLIEQGTSLPSQTRLHKLSGEYEGLWECHIEFDWLMIFGMTETTIVLIRTGSHADLF